MNCPKDGSVMREKLVDGHQLELCGKCEGLWMDWGELTSVSNGAATEHELIFRGASTRICPKCGGRMRKANLHSVIVEECGCGLFFDKGEAKRVVGRELEFGDKTIMISSQQLETLNKDGLVRVDGFELKIDD